MSNIINCSQCGEEIDTGWMSECPLCEQKVSDIDLHDVDGRDSEVHAYKQGSKNDRRML